MFLSTWVTWCIVPNRLGPFLLVTTPLMTPLSSPVVILALAVEVNWQFLVRRLRCSREVPLTTLPRTTVIPLLTSARGRVPMLSGLLPAV